MVQDSPFKMEARRTGVYGSDCTVILEKKVLDSIHIIYIDVDLH